MVPSSLFNWKIDVPIEFVQREVLFGGRWDASRYFYLSMGIAKKIKNKIKIKWSDTFLQNELVDVVAVVS